MRLLLPPLLALAGWLVTSPALAAPTTYDLDPSASWVTALIRYDRNAWVAGHDHGLRATDFTGTVTWDPDDVSACDIDIRIPYTALSFDTPGLRDRLGLEGTTPDSDKKAIRKNALSKGQLDSDSYSSITYRSTSCSDAGGGKAKVTGTMTVRGVSKSITTTMKVSADGSRFEASGSVGITHTMFGFDPYVVALGAIRNDDPIQLSLDFVGSAR